MIFLLRQRHQLRCLKGAYLEFVKTGFDGQEFGGEKEIASWNNKKDYDSTINNNSRSPINGC